MASRIEDYGLIGNTRTAALVSRSGSIDWLCAPRFDSDACFAALVGYDEHGRWALRPAVRVRESKQRYRDNSMVLETDSICEGGAVRITDFMPIADGCDVVRIVEGLDGRGAGRDAADRPLRLRRGLAADRDDADGTLFMAGPDALILRGPLALTQVDRRVSSMLQVRKGDRIPLQLTWFPSHLQPPADDRPRRRRWRATDALLAGMGRPLHLPGTVARRRAALAADAEGDDVRAHGRRSWRRRRRRCPKRSAASATGTIATAGCATRA